MTNDDKQWWQTMTNDERWLAAVEGFGSAREDKGRICYIWVEIQYNPFITVSKGPADIVSYIEGPLYWNIGKYKLQWSVPWITLYND